MRYSERERSTLDLNSDANLAPGPIMDATHAASQNSSSNFAARIIGLESGVDFGI